MCSLQRSPFPDCWTSLQQKPSSTRLKLLSSGSLRSETVCMGVSVWSVCITYRAWGGLKKGKSMDQRRCLGMQTAKEKIASLWESFVLSAITSMCAPEWNLGRRKCLGVAIPERWAFWPSSPGGGGNKEGNKGASETLWDWLPLVSINKHSNNLTWT